MKLVQLKKYLLLIDEEAEIKEENIAIHDFGMGYDLEIPCNKDNLKSNTRKLVVAYYPLTKEAKELDLPLLPEHDIEGFRVIQDKQFTLDDIIKAYDVGASDGYRHCEGNNYYPDTDTPNDENADENFKEDREEFIQSLSTQQLPKEFIVTYERVRDWDSRDINGDYSSKLQLKTTTNSEGKKILVGTYKY